MKHLIFVCLLFLAGCSEDKKIENAINLELQGSGVKVTKVEIGNDVGGRCKLVRITTSNNVQMIGAFRFDGNHLDEHYHPNHTIFGPYDDPAIASQLALCN